MKRLKTVWCVEVRWKQVGGKRPTPWQFHELVGCRALARERAASLRRSDRDWHRHARVVPFDRRRA